MTNHRSAITGQYVTAEHAEANPDTTVSEERTRRPAGDYSDLRARAQSCPPEDDADSWYSEDRLEFAIGTQDRPFVAACSPTVVLGLLDELDRLRGVNHTLTVALYGANVKIVELSDLVEVEYAGRMRLAEQVRAVRKLHHEVDVPALGPDCSAEECEHENDCPSVPTPVCDHCHAIGESASPYPFEEAPGLTEVSWHCKTISILDGDTLLQHAREIRQAS